MKASNKARVDLFGNDFVCAYRKFEEETIFSPHKADRMERISQVDGRKVRWILIYTTYQTLRSCTNVPAEVREAKDVPYSLAISTANLPPWGEERPSRPLLRRQTDMAMAAPRPATSGTDSPVRSLRTPSGLEITPDVDYFAITHKEEPRSLRSGPPSIPPRSQSLRKNFSATGTIRRSLSLFRHTGPATPPPSQPRSRRPSYHEIVVHGYGNGTNMVNVAMEDHEADRMLPPAMPASRSPSTSSDSSTGSSAKSRGSNSDSSGSLPESPRTDYSASPAPEEKKAPSVPPRGRPLSRQYLPLRRSFSETAVETRSSSIYSQSDVDMPPAVPARSQARNSIYIEQDALSCLQPSPLRLRKKPSVLDEDTWSGTQGEIARRSSIKRTNMAANDIQPAWEQYWDLGGHTELPPASTNF
jgi:hypothetical protein